MTKILLSSLLLATVVHATEVVNTTEVKTTAESTINETSTETVTEKVSIDGLTASTKDSGWYVGVSTGLLNWGGEVTIDDGYREKTYEVDTEDKPMMLKVGYVTESENRIELYYKSDSIEAEEDGRSLNLYDTSTFGINYQWGISSFSTNEMLPYISVGIGMGSGEIDGSSTDFDAVEVNLGLGVHYQVAQNIDISAGLYRRAIVIGADNSDLVIATALNGIEVGASYHF